MEKICIFTDSSADIPKEEVEKFGIEIIPILVTAGDRTFREYFDITPEEYWKLLRGDPVHGTDDRTGLPDGVPART